MQFPIRNWFTEHDAKDGDFFVSTRPYPYSVIPPTDTVETIVYCTKPHCILRSDLDDNPSFGAILRGGLPSDEDANWLRSTMGSRSFLFLGDADPVDLLIFAWLRQRLPIKYIGLTDQLLRQCGVPQGDQLVIPLDESERAALPIVTQHLGDLRVLLGEWCAGLLSSGRKIEVEAMISFADCSRSEIEAAILTSPEGGPEAG